MRIDLEIVSGARAGFRDAFDKSYIALGRDPLADVRFDAEQDLDASAKHAAVLLRDGGYAVRDLGSRNGTYVNGRRVSGDTPLADGDVIRCGTTGPEVRVRFPREQAEQVMRPVAVPPPAAARPAPRTAGAPKGASASPPSRPPAPSATSVLRAQVRASKSHVRALLIVLGIVIVGAAAILIWQGYTARRQQAQTLSVLDSLGRENTSLRTAKVAADSEAARLRREIAAARDPARIAALQEQYSSVQRRQRDIATAQGVDYRAIMGANSPGVAIVFVQFEDSSPGWSGTGFGVTADGTMLTNRHLVIDDQGRRPLHIAVQFSGSRDVLPGRFVRAAPDADIAVIQVESRGPFPVVQGLDPTADAQAGDPIALIGFPLGLDLPQDSKEVQPMARASLMTGTISKTLPDSLLQLDAFSGTGASGSPILDRHGRVIGIEFGGIRESQGRVVLGLPIRRAMALLAR
jgi:S1-C subfamily serine protease